MHFATLVVVVAAGLGADHLPYSLKFVFELLPLLTQLAVSLASSSFVDRWKDCCQIGDWLYLEIAAAVDVVVVHLAKKGLAAIVGAVVALKIVGCQET